MCVWVEREGKESYFFLLFFLSELDWQPGLPAQKRSKESKNLGNLRWFAMIKCIAVGITARSAFCLFADA